MNAAFVMVVAVMAIRMEFTLFEAANSPKDLRKWKNNQVYYFINEFDFFSEEKDRVERAVSDIENIVCVNITRVFDPKWTTPEGGNPVKIVDADGCWSHVGNQFPVIKKLFHQEISLSEKCRTDATIKHVFLHLLGLENEQSRSDRNDFIHVYKERINKKDEFDIKKGNTFGPFDFQSVMLSPPWDTKKVGWPIYTVKEDKVKADEVMFPATISWQDARALNQIYECGKKCEKTCDTDAYLSKDCECVTPDMFAERQCKDSRDDCRLLVHKCRIDEQFTSQCRKTCKSCYKSPNGVGERGTIEICEDAEAEARDYNNRFQKEYNSYYSRSLDCSSADSKYYFPKFCKSGCAQNTILDIKNECQDFKTNCFDTKCYDEYSKDFSCAKSCRFCG